MPGVLSQFAVKPSAVTSEAALATGGVGLSKVVTVFEFADVPIGTDALTALTR